MIRPTETVEEFKKVIRERGSNASATIDQFADKILRYYSGYDYSARRAYVKNVLTIYANYENKYFGEVDDLTGEWRPDSLLGTEVAFSVPLFKPHVDTGITFYCKAKPDYKAVPRISDYSLKALASMCEKIAFREYKRMFTTEILQREAQYMFLAGRSFRQVYSGISEDSPAHLAYERKEINGVTSKISCGDCGTPIEELNEVVCPNCFSENLVEEQVETVNTVDVPVISKIPRPQVAIPNPVSIQTDFGANNFKSGAFLIKRSMRTKGQAEYYYNVDLSGSAETKDFSTQAADRLSREPLIGSDSAYATTDMAFSFGNYFTDQNRKIEECEMWLDPCEYALFNIAGTVLGEQYPKGLYLHFVGDKLVEQGESVRRDEWIGLVCGVRPTASNGTGMQQLAEMNDLINNMINLEYSVLRTAGFPLTVLRGRYLKELPEALQTIIMDNLPDEMSLDQVIHRVQPTNASGMLGVLSQRMEGYMQFAGATWSAVGGAPDVRDMMGTATGALAVQEMMSDRLGLAIQSRIQADIDTFYIILKQIQGDKSQGNREMLLKEFDAATVNQFFEADLKSLVNFEIVEGSEEPKTDSVTTMKAQIFAQITASLSNLAEIDKPAYLDLVSSVGDSLGLPVEIGKGRKERNLANNRISQVEMLYNQLRQSPEVQMLNPTELGVMLFQKSGEGDLAILELDPTIETLLYDYEALAETYSDWLQSNEGQSSPAPVRVAVAMLFSYCQKVLATKAQNEQDLAMQQQQQMLEMQQQMSPQQGGTPPEEQEAPAEEQEEPMEEEQPQQEMTGEEDQDSEYSAI